MNLGLYAYIKSVMLVAGYEFEVVIPGIYGGIANNSATVTVRGLPRNGSNGPIYIVDGI